MMSNRAEVLKKFREQEAETAERVQYGIEHYRKGDVRVHLSNPDGTPAAGTQVHIRQTKHEFKYGANLFMLDELETPEKNEQYKKYFSEAFNMATLPFYWSDLEPQKGHPRYASDSPKIYRRPAPDLCLDFCRAHGIEPREHALAYEHWFPDWLRNEPVSVVKRELSRRMHEIAERYADAIPTIEVTNEMHWGSGKTAFYESDDYISWCFQEAARQFPNNQLGINDWAGIWFQCARNRDWYYRDIQQAIADGARIDTIGMQFHMFYRAEDEYKNTEKVYDPQHLYKILDRYADFRRPIEITEVTIPAYTYDPADEEIQAELIKNLYTIWFSHPNVEHIIYWNLVDGYAAFAPQGDFTAGENYYRGGLLRFDFTPKPAYYMVRDLFQKVWHTEQDIVADENGVLNFRGFYGDYDLTVNGKTVSLCASAHGLRNFDLTIG